jgi:molybdopterin-biosynthesis enzyme MoeA-like protein
VRAEIILVGEELLEDTGGVLPDYMDELLGELSSDLEARGFSLGRLTVVGDGPGELAPLLEDAGSRKVDLVLTIGGLGPTHDDRVREEVAEAMGRGPPESHPDAFRWLVDTFRRKEIPVPDGGGSWERMGQVPKGADPIHNPEGMAAGLAFEIGEGTHVRCLPGVTFEALPMWREEIVPTLENLGGPLPGQGKVVLIIRGASEGVVGPIVEEFDLTHPGIRARVNLIERHGTSFRAIKVTLSGDPRTMRGVVAQLANIFYPIAGVTVEMMEEGMG